MRAREDIDYSRLPEHMRASIRGYIERGQPVGHFLTALLSDQLVEGAKIQVNDC